MITRNIIRARAEELLRQAGTFSAPVDVESIAQNLGLVISPEPFEGDMSGCLVRRSGARPVIGVNSTHAPTRKRFTIAHEIGHYLLHSGSVYLDRESSFRVNLRDSRSSTGEDAIEREANSFAAELLMPKVLVLGDLPGQINIQDPQGMEFVHNLARKYEVSPQAMSYRLMNLGAF